MSQTFGSWLQREMKAADMNLGELGERCGVSKGYLSKLARGLSTEPTEPVVRRIADGLGVDHDVALLAAGLPTGMPLALQDVEAAQALRLLSAMSEVQRRRMIDLMASFVPRPAGV